MIHWKFTVAFVTLFSVSSISQTIPWLSREIITGAHDPTIIKDERGVYTLLTTNNMLQLRQSDNMLNWRNAGNVLQNIPAYMNNVEDIWAPQIVFRNGRYWVYYCGSTFGTNNSWIGVASSPTLNIAAPNYGWTDHGEVIKSIEANNYNCIDPELIVDFNNKIWMSFGSFWSGIKMIAIDPVTGKQLASDKTIYSIASRGGGAIEGPAFSKNNGYYYLYTAWDKCCSGLTSTYKTMVGRSQNIAGPYLDKAGRSLSNSGGTQLMGTYGRYIGPGGGSPFNDGRRSYFVHHYYNRNQNGAPNLQIREIVYDNSNWPYFTQPFLGRRLSYEAEHAELTNVDILTTSTASNQEYVGGVDAADSRIVFHINALQSGEQTLRIRYSSPNLASSHFVKINNLPETEIFYLASPGTIDFPDTRVANYKVNLNEGYNAITFRKGSGIAYLDRIDLLKNARISIEAGSFDDSKVAEYVSTGNNAVISSGDWVQYENIDFGQFSNDRALLSFSGSCVGQVRLNLDGVNGSINTSSTINVTQATSDYSINLPSSFSNTKGVHDVFFTYTGTGNCNLDNFRFTNSTITGLTDIPDLESLTVYPNPFSDQIEMHSENEVSFEIVNMLGESITSGKFQGTTLINNILEKGTYFIHFSEAGKFYSKKIIKQ